MDQRTLLTQELRARVRTNDLYLKDMPVFDDTIVGYMRLIDDQPFIFRFKQTNPDEDLEKPICKLSVHYDVDQRLFPDAEICRRLNRILLNGHALKANSIPRTSFCRKFNRKSNFVNRCYSN